MLFHIETELSENMMPANSALQALAVSGYRTAYCPHSRLKFPLRPIFFSGEQFLPPLTPCLRA
jgi:hypothetical protein